MPIHNSPSDDDFRDSIDIDSDSVFDLTARLESCDEQTGVALLNCLGSKRLIEITGQGFELTLLFRALVRSEALQATVLTLLGGEKLVAIIRNSTVLCNILKELSKFPGLQARLLAPFEGERLIELIRSEESFIAIFKTLSGSQDLQNLFLKRLKDAMLAGRVTPSGGLLAAVFKVLPARGRVDLLAALDATKLVRIIKDSSDLAAILEALSGAEALQSELLSLFADEKLFRLIGFKASFVTVFRALSDSQDLQASLLRKLKNAIATGRVIPVGGLFAAVLERLPDGEQVDLLTALSTEKLVGIISDDLELATILTALSGAGDLQAALLTKLTFERSAGLIINTVCFHEILDALSGHEALQAGLLSKIKDRILAGWVPGQWVFLVNF